MTKSIAVSECVNRYQSGFPLCPEPFAAIGDEFAMSGEAVLSEFRSLAEAGVLSRVGPVFNQKKVGASTLAALEINSDKIDELAEMVNSFDGVNHNYERENDLNLWFVVTASDEKELSRVLEEIEKCVGLKVYTFPMVEEYTINLGFNLEVVK